MELQPRDLSILEAVGELGTADTAMIHSLFFPKDKTGRSCQNRLKKIADAGLLKSKRLIASDGYKTSGSVPMLYFLSPAGGDIVERETGILPLRVTRSDPKQMTLRHRMEVVRARLAIDQAAEKLKVPKVEWIMEQDTRRRSKATKGRSPTEDQILNERYFDEERKRSVAFRPDAAFHLQIPRPSGDGFKSLLGYVELDRSTEGHLQWERKLLGIEAFFNDASGWLRHWPDVAEPAVVLFVICKSYERLNNLATTTRGFAIAKLTRLTTFPVGSETVLTEPVWQDCQGKLFTIIKPR